VQTLRGTLAALHGQMTIVVATHDLRLASLADQLLDLTDMASRTPTAGRAEFADSAG
jgi:ABC-type lipoprotein export system ATPase subunit